MKVYSIISDYSKEAIDKLKSSGISVDVNSDNKNYNTNDLIDLLEKYDVLVIGVKTIISKEILKYVKSPKIIASLSIGLDHIDEDVINSNKVKVINIKKSIAHSVAEHIFSLILSLSKRIYESNSLVLEGNGNRKFVHEKPEDIFGKTLGLVGAGNITKEVAKIAKCFNMNMICYTQNPDKHRDLLEYGVVFEDLDRVLKDSDIINISVPLNNKTNNIVSQDKIDLMKNNAIFINTSRAEVVDVDYLLKKADNYSSFYVGLDIDCDKYYNLFNVYRKNVVITPHIAGVTKQSIDKMDLEIAKELISLNK